MGNESADQKPETYQERMTRIFARHETMNDIITHVAQGGTLVTLAETWDIRYADVCRWINGNKERFELYRQALDDRAEWVKESILAELRGLALSDLREAFDDNGNLKDIKSLPRSIARAIASVEIEDLFSGHGEDREHIGYTKKVKFWDKTKSIEMVMKNLGLLIERHVLTGAKLEDLLAASREEPAKPTETTPDEKTSPPTPQ